MSSRSSAIFGFLLLFFIDRCQGWGEKKREREKEKQKVGVGNKKKKSRAIPSSLTFLFASRSSHARNAACCSRTRWAIRCCSCSVRDRPKTPPAEG